MVIGWICSRDLFETSWEGIHEVLPIVTAEESRMFTCVLSLPQWRCYRNFEPLVSHTNVHPYTYTGVKYSTRLVLYRVRYTLFRVMQSQKEGVCVCVCVCVWGGGGGGGVSLWKTRPRTFCSNARFLQKIDKLNYLAGLPVVKLSCVWNLGRVSQSVSFFPYTR